MRLSVKTAVLLAGVLALSACGANNGRESERSIIGVVDESDLNDIMLTVADPNESVNYFRAATIKDPERIDLKRGLAQSLARAKRSEEANAVYEIIVASGEATNKDRMDYAESLIRTSEWKAAEAQLNAVPPTVETFQRYRLEAIVADAQQNWTKADSFYETAAGLTTQPANVLNNWGYSKLTRKKYDEAERLFLRAITYDKELFTAKNNLVLARGSQRKYALPVIPMTEVERAELLYTLALTAIKQGDTDIGRGLLETAIDTHPRHFQEAVRTLQALQPNVAR
jgi:Flp pilus assembly protein TadD